MKSIKNLIRAGALGLALVGATFIPTKQAHADGGAVVAGIAGGLLLGTIIGSTAHANHGGYYYSDPYYAPAPVYSAPTYYYPPAVTYGFSYSSGRHYGGHRRHYRGRGHHGGRHYRRGHGHHRRGHGHHRW